MVGKVVGSDAGDARLLEQQLSARKCSNICRSGPAHSCSLDFTFFSPSYLPLGPSTSIRDVKEALSEGPGSGRGMSRLLWERSPQPT